MFIIRWMTSRRWWWCTINIIIMLILFNIRFYVHEKSSNDIIYFHTSTSEQNKLLQHTFRTTTTARAARNETTIIDDEWETKRNDMLDHIILPKRKNCRFPKWDQKNKKQYKLDWMRKTTTSKKKEDQPSRNGLQQKLMGLHDHNTNTKTDHGGGVGKTIIKQQLLQQKKRDICFIHIGKTAGTTIECNLRIGKHANRMCRKGKKLEENGALSPQTTCRWHLTGTKFIKGQTMKGFKQYKSFLLSIRNPIHRIVSTYFYDFKHLIHGTHVTCGMAMIYSCFTKIDDLASLGLYGPRPPLPFRYLVNTDLTKKECQEWAWGFVQGTAASWKHNYFNYNYYTAPILSDTTNEIFVIRSEHLWYDWKAIDVLVGGEGTLPMSWNHSRNVNKQEERRDDKAISSSGMTNLCRALCDEVQIYKQLLFRAVNLLPRDVEESLLELKMICPEEGSITPRNCTY